MGVGVGVGVSVTLFIHAAVHGKEHLGAMLITAVHIVVKSIIKLIHRMKNIQYRDTFKNRSSGNSIKMFLIIHHHPSCTFSQIQQNA
jgi:hypothetical protein